MAERSTGSIVTSAVMLIRSNTVYAPRLMNCWLPAETWVEALQQLGHIDASLNFTVRQFNAAFARSGSFGSVMTRFDGSNESGIFRVSFQHRHYYYLTLEKQQVAYPCPLDQAWKDRVFQVAANVLVIPSTRARPSLSCLPTACDKNNDADSETVNPVTLHEQESPSKRQRVEESTTSSRQELGVSSSYWPDSPEARQVFRPRNTSITFGGPRESAKEAVERRIKLLQMVNEDAESWRNIIIGRDEKDFCSKSEIFEIRQRAVFLCLAYQLAIKKMNDWTWYDCCKEACKQLNRLGLNQAKFYKTIANWNKIFRKFESFAHPNPLVRCGKRPMPRLLEVFPDAKDQIVTFGVRNLATLTIESVHDLIINTVIPRLTATWEKETTIMNAVGNTADAPEQARSRVTAMFLRSHRLESMSLTTTWRWMRLLGFQYDSRKKSFYVDGHERDDVVANRSIFCKRYLTEYEPYCNRWIQLSLNEARTIKNLNVTFGYSYFDVQRNEERIEIHVDYWNRISSQQRRNQDKERGHQNAAADRLNNHHEKKATTSIRVSAPTMKPIMIVGQDESVFAQYHLGNKTWVGPKGQRPLLPKSDGDGYMLSAFVSREFGFGRDLSEDELAKINHEQRIGKTYIDTQAAMEVLKTTEKPLLTESPFVRYLYIGANNEGYWNSFQMSVQLEDVVDCLRVLYPEYDIVFLFDHSQGHARKRNGALNTIQMSRAYGGAQAIIRDTTILDADGFLGPFLPCFLNIGNVQSFVFKPGDSGPFYLTPEQREIQRHNRPTGKIKRVERSKKQLVNALTDAGVTFHQQRSYTKKELQDFARIRGIDLHEDKEQILLGWEGQPKGLLQALWERGMIDEQQLERYTLDGRKNPFTGIVDLQYSLRHLLSECKDFKDEETALQYLGTQLGVTVDLTPKFHAELAGEGVEYCWAQAKSYYRRVPVSRKRGRENFKALVRECTSSQNVITKGRVEKYAARARAYICTYHHLEQAREVHPPAAAAAAAHPKEELLLTDIERVSKALRCHRCVLDFDLGFVNSVLKEEAMEAEDQNDNVA